MYRLVKQNANNVTKRQKQHSLIIRDQTHRQQHFVNLFKKQQHQFDTARDIMDLNEIADFTIKPIPIYNFTKSYVPIKVAGLNLGEGIAGVISDVADVGLK